MFTLTVNEQRFQVDVPPNMPLLWVLRDVIGLTGTKFGCGIAQCGACTVQVAGQAMRSCVLAVSALGGRPVTTVEGVGQTPMGQRVQQAWAEIEVVQCGYCQPGQVMSAAALLTHTPHPSDADIDAGQRPHVADQLAVGAQNLDHPPLAGQAHIDLLHPRIDQRWFDPAKLFLRPRAEMLRLAVVHLIRHGAPRAGAARTWNILACDP